MLNSFADLGKAIEENGDFHYQQVFKLATPIPGTAGFFVDMNQTSGTPKYNAFAGPSLSLTPLTGVGNAGVYAGPFVTGKNKYLSRWQVLNPSVNANTVSPDQIFLCDYLGFYPLIDCDDLDSQTFDNSLSLTRYQNGEGVRIVLIVQAPMGITAPITITYTNSIGISDRSVTFDLIPGLNIGVCATGSGVNGALGNSSPFMPLANGDSGVRSIESVQLASGAGGFICAALVKPLAEIMTYESGVPVEKIFGFNSINSPEILNGAYLNFLINRSGSLAGSLRSELLFLNT